MQDSLTVKQAGTPLAEKSTIDEIRARFDNEVERFSRLETGQQALTFDGDLQTPKRPRQGGHDDQVGHVFRLIGEDGRESVSNSRYEGCPGRRLPMPSQDQDA